MWSVQKERLIASTGWLIFISLALFGQFSCQDFTPVQLQKESVFLPPPQNVVLKLGNGSVTLRWEYPDTIAVKEFRIYRRSSGDEDFTRIATTEEKWYRDTFLANGSRYEYEIAAVSKEGIEGEHSKSVVGVPAIYSLIINDGTVYTNSRQVKITITAPNNTTLMMLSNDSAFTNAKWEQFKTTRYWDLSFGDGPKTVYAKFRNIDDQELDQPVKADIILDQVAIINFLEEDSNGKILQSGDTLHIKMGTGEIGGKASVDIVDVSRSVNDYTAREEDIKLFDDGSHGDKVPNDGIYERDYYVRQGLQMEMAFVFGRFEDAAGNQARATASSRVTIQSRPLPVYLFEPIILSSDIPKLKIRWTANHDGDFAAYQLVRSKSSNISLASRLITEIEDINVVSYTDVDLEPGTEYYYQIYVFDQAGNNSGSNVVKATTPENVPPKPVVLSQPVQDTLSLKLTWSPSTAEDFANYRLYRSVSSPVDTTYAPIAIINDANITEFRDFSATPNITYFYRIFVFDKWGLSAGSNEVRGKFVR
ncbi:MAG: choice-of-anchor X domain-containing protein [candidate division KSB1 bacterium]|nr:choice-of-anchor X domain-containing protein [candidate division KSB1 bacterium]